MLEMKPDLHFEPSKTTKTLWRYVRKSPATFAGVTLPGLFQCTNFALDTFGFAAVLVLEAWGLVNLLRVGQTELLFVIFLGLLDVIFAVCRHLPAGRICERENRLLVVDDPADKENLHSQIRRLRLVVWFFTLLMLGVALFKVVSFQALQGGVFNGLTAAILVSYLLTWVLHISATGYFLCGLVTAAFLRYDQVRFLRGGHSRAALAVTTHRRHPFCSKAPLEAVRVYKHILEPVAQAEDTYELRTWGLLTDDHLHSLTCAQADSEARRQVAVQGLTHQLEILQSAPSRSEESSAPQAAKGRSAGTVDAKEANGQSKADWNTPPVMQAKCLLAALGLSAVTMIGCTKPQSQGDSYTPFPLTVVLTHSVAADQEGATAKDLLDLALPFLGKGCAAVFFPQVSFVRLDRDPASRIQLAPVDLSGVEAEAHKRRAESAFGKIRSFYGQPPSIEELREVVSPMLKNAATWDTLATPGDHALDVKEVISFPRQTETAKIFVLTRSAAEQDQLLAAMSTELLPAQEVVAVTDAEQLAELTGAYLCATFAATVGTATQFAPVVVIYQPVIEGREVASAQAGTAEEVAKLPEAQDSQDAVEPQAPAEEDLRRIREHLQQGRLRQALQAVESLRRAQPHEAEVQRLQAEIEREVQVRIEARVLGEASGHHTLNTQTALITLQGGERSFRFYIEPHEAVYLYLYRVGRGGNIEALFPQANGYSSDPLRAGQVYWLPSSDPARGYLFSHERADVEEIYIVSSRWPAHDLEQWAAELAGQDGVQAGDSILRALQERKAANVGGCDVRTLQFAAQG